MSVLFSDIRGFTTVTERGQPEEIVAQLNEYFTRMVDVCSLIDGTLDKFVGDMVMALFGAPLDDRAHADHAVAGGARHDRASCAELNRRVGAGGPADDRYRDRHQQRGDDGGEHRIGDDLSYTVIGDAVNLGLAPRVPEQAVRDPDHRQRQYTARSAQAAL